MHSYNSKFGSPSIFGLSQNPGNNQISSTERSMFGGTSSGVFGASSSSTSSTAFGSPMPAFTGSSALGLGFSSSSFGSSIFGQKPIFGTSSSGFSFTSSPSFSQPTMSSFSSSFPGNIQSPFQPQTSLSGCQASIPTAWSTGFQQPVSGQKHWSRVEPYRKTVVNDEKNGERLLSVSVSAMPVYSGKSHEELRWEDKECQLAGGSRVGTTTIHPKAFTPFTPPRTPAFTFTSSNTAFSSSSCFNTSSSPIFLPSTNSSTAPSNPFTPQKPTNIFPTTTSSSSANLFWTTPSSSTHSSPPSTVAVSSFGPNNNNSSQFLFRPSTSAATSSSFSIFPSNFVTSASPAPSSCFTVASSTSPTIFTSTPSISSGFASTSCFAPLTQPSPLFTTLSPSSNASFLPSKPNQMIPSPSTGSTFEKFSCIPSQISMTTLPLPGPTTTSLSPPFQPAQTVQTNSTALAGKTNGSSAVQGLTGVIGQNNAAQEFVSPSVPSVVNPFGTLPAMRQASYVSAGSTSSLHFGISSMPVRDKQAPSRHSSSLLTARNLSQRRNRFPLQKYNPKSDPKKVPFFIDDCQATFYPRENPRDLIISPLEHWPKRDNSEKCSSLKPTHVNGYENGQNFTEACVPVSDVAIHEDEDGENYTSKASTTEDPASLYNKPSVADVIMLMPKLHKSPEYYTEPEIQDLESMELVEPGSISRVEDFVIGRHGYGRIKFLGPTDVRQLDLESLVQFNKREVIVYPDENKKHVIGQGLNKAAEVTLLNIKCFDKRSGKHCVDGIKAVKYREMLIKKASDQGADFVSYDPVKGEWKFKVHHFV